MSDARDLLRRTAEIAADYLESLGERPVFPQVTPEQLREALGGPLARGAARCPSRWSKTSLPEPSPVSSRWGAAATSAS